MVKSKTILSIFIVFLMCSGSLTLLAHYNPSQSSNSSNNPIAKPDLSSVSETASTSIGVSYYTLNTTVANSGTTTVTLNSKEASSQQTASIDSTSAYSLNSGNTVGTTTALGGSYQVWINQVNIGTSSNPDVVGEIASSQLYSLAFASGKYSSTVYDVGTVYANLTVDGSIYSWSHTFNSEVTSSTQVWDEFSPSWTGKAPSSGSGPSASGYYTASLQIQITADSGYNFDNAAPAELISFAGSSTTNAINTGEPSQATINFITGWTYSGQSVSSSYTIPEYTTAYQITWSTTQSGAIDYGSSSSTTSPITGSLTTANSVSFNSNGADPNVISYTFSYYLSGQNQVVPTSATQTSSPAYTYAQVSGTEVPTVE